MGKITATVVKVGDRPEFLPKRLGIHLARGMNLPFAFADQLSDDYRGGFWDYFELSNGGWYMAPMHDRKFACHWPGNYYEGEMSADALGVTSTLFALCYLAEFDEQFSEDYHKLRDFAMEHAEAAQIVQAID